MLNKEVQAFYMCYSDTNNDYTKLRYDLITSIVYGVISINSNGSLRYWYCYNPNYNRLATNIIQYAHNRGIKVVLMFTTDSNIETDILLADPIARTTAITNLINEVVTLNFDGIDNGIEFGNTINSITGSSNKALMTAFHTELADRLWSINPNYQISIELEPNNWKDIWDVTTLQNKVTYMSLIGYDYISMRSTKTGPNAPMDQDIAGQLAKNWYVTLDNPTTNTQSVDMILYPDIEHIAQKVTMHSISGGISSLGQTVSIGIIPGKTYKSEFDITLTTATS